MDYNTNGVHCMLEERNHQCIDMVPAFICRYEDKKTGYVEDTKLTRVNKIYFELLLELYFKCSKGKRDLEA